MRPFPFAFFLAALAIPAVAQAQEVHHGMLKGPGGADLGTITVTAAPKGVLLRIEAKGLTPGWHGMHFHEKGACSDDKFASAGGHVHMMMPVTHGFLNPAATDDGDLPNLYVGRDGTATVELYSTYVLLKGDATHPALLGGAGRAVIIHVNPDDYTTQPIGDAGARVACAVIE